MGIRKYRPITPGTRTRVASDFSEVTGRGRERGLVVAKHQRKGRNNRGVITCRHTRRWPQAPLSPGRLPS